LLDPMGFLLSCSELELKFPINPPHACAMTLSGRFPWCFVIVPFRDPPRRPVKPKHDYRMKYGKMHTCIRWGRRRL
jgi:hypothetical protein